MAGIDIEPSSETQEWTTEKYRVSTSIDSREHYEEIYRRSGESLQRQEYERCIRIEYPIPVGGMPELILDPEGAQHLRAFFDTHEDIDVGIEGAGIIFSGWRGLSTDEDMETYRHHQEAETRFAIRLRLNFFPRLQN